MSAQRAHSWPACRSRAVDETSNMTQRRRRRRRCLLPSGNWRGKNNALAGYDTVSSPLEERRRIRRRKSQFSHQSYSTKASFHNRRRKGRLFNLKRQDQLAVATPVFTPILRHPREDRQFSHQCSHQSHQFSHQFTPVFTPILFTPVFTPILPVFTPVFTPILSQFSHQSYSTQGKIR